MFEFSFMYANLCYASQFREEHAAHIHTYIHICIYIYIYVHIHIYICIS